MKLIKNMAKMTLESTVYGKINKSNNIISHDSFLPFNYKLADYNFSLTRAFKVCSRDHLQIELYTIKHIATENRFVFFYVNRLINSAQNHRMTLKNI